MNNPRTFPECSLNVPNQADFRLYNDGLIALAPLDVPFTAFGKGTAALGRLRAFMDAHICAIAADDSLRTDAKYCCVRELMEAVDENGNTWSRWC